MTNVSLTKSRLGLLVADPTALWTGTVSAWDSATMILTVSTVSGALSVSMEHLLLVHAGAALHRVRVVTPGSNTIKLAETSTEFTSGDTLAIYDARLPWPRYQRIVDSNVYKDYDVGFPATWQAHLPPIARINVSGDEEAIWCAVGESVYVSGDGDAQLDDGAPVTYAWDPGAGGTAVTPTAQNTYVSWSSGGFRYLKLTVTDAHGTESKHYQPVWVGHTPHTQITECSARWHLMSGWEVELTLVDPPSHLKYSPAAVVDLENGAVVFFGFLMQDTRRSNFERGIYRYRLLPALAFSRYLHSYPLIVESITGAETPDNWAEVYGLTLARAMWFLLYWHSTLSEVANVQFSSSEAARAIAGQEFSAGAVSAQFDALAKSAFWAIWGRRGGGLYVAVNPLYRDSADWDALGSLALGSTHLHEEIAIEYAEPQISEMRLAGIYRSAAGEFAPVIVRAPSAPEPWGTPAELTGLAPEDAAELRLWAGRRVGIENHADCYTIQPTVWFEPGSPALVDLT